MTDQAQKQTKGIIATITDNGMIDIQAIGTLNEAEFLGIGAYLSDVLLKDSIRALHKGQGTISKSLDKVCTGLELVATSMTESELLPCGKDSSSEQLPLWDSGSSSESSQK